MSGSTRLTLLQQLEIRKRVAEGETQLSLAGVFGVHKKTIWRIVNADESSLKEPATSSSKSDKASSDTYPPFKQKPLVEGYHNPYVRYGNLTVTQEGSYLQRDPDGKLVRLLSCPVYNARQRYIGRYDVDVLDMQGKFRGRGRIKRWSGETIEGEIVLQFKANSVSRIEFHPDTLPQEYRDREKALRGAARNTA